jgi:hypothetical protein
MQRDSSSNTVREVTVAEGIVPQISQGGPCVENSTASDATASFHVAMHPSTRCAGWRFFRWSDDSVAQGVRSNR